MIHLLGPNEVLIGSDVVTLGEQQELTVWAQERHTRGELLANPVDVGVFSTPFRASDRALTRRLQKDVGDIHAQNLIWMPEADESVQIPLPDAFWTIRDRVIRRLKIESLREDNYKGSFLSYTSPGSSVHKHLDSKLTEGGQEFRILRCNVLFRKPSEGGLPEFDCGVVDIPERGFWAFYPTDLVHAASPVIGRLYRGLLSFGFLVSDDELFRRGFKISTEFRSAMGLGDDPNWRSAVQERLAQKQSDQTDSAQLAILNFAVSKEGYFSVEEAAAAADVSPVFAHHMLIILHKNRMIESMSSDSILSDRILYL